MKYLGVMLESATFSDASRKKHFLACQGKMLANS